MLMIRLFRTGRKNQPAYKVVVTEKTNPPARGRFVEEVGFYNPLTKEKNLNAERIKYWISVGAQPSGTIHNMLVKEKIIEGDIIPKHKKAKEKKEGEPAAAAPEQGSEEKTKEAPTTEAKTEEKTETQEEKPVEPEKTEEPASEPEVKEEVSVEKKEESKDSKESPKEEPKEEKTE